MSSSTQNDESLQPQSPSGPIQRFLNMPYIKLIRDHLGRDARMIIAMGIVSGLSNGVIVAIINAGATSREKGTDDLVFYVLLFLATVICFLYSSNFLLTKSVMHSEGIVRQFRTTIADRIRRSELCAFDELETTQVYVTLSDNTNRISQAALPIFNACGAVVMIAFCLAYILTISTAAFIFTIGISSLIAIIYMQVSEKVEALFGSAYAEEKQYFHLVQQLLNGIKEVKLSGVRSNDLFDGFIIPRAAAAQTNKVNANELHVRNYLNSKLFIFFVTASFIFGLPLLHQVSNNDIISLTAVALFMFSPIGALVESIPLLAQANVAVIKLRELEHYLAVTETPAPIAGRTIPETVDGITLTQAAFSYHAKDGDTTFTVGPVDMEARKGEVTFLVGGNGSGKSTLLKMITGLYPLESGSLKVGGLEVTLEQRAFAREHFSAIFSDFHLFDRFYGMQDVPPFKVNDLIEKMRLAHKTRFIDSHFSNIELSTGQRKRLALITALLEDRPICVFDEVASDQDPDFRTYFYKDILGQLKARGKIVLVVSHDREFFGMADRIYRLDYGKLTVAGI